PNSLRSKASQVGWRELNKLFFSVPVKVMLSLVSCSKVAVMCSPGMLLRPSCQVGLDDGGGLELRFDHVSSFRSGQAPARRPSASCASSGFHRHARPNRIGGGSSPRATALRMVGLESFR